MTSYGETRLKNYALWYYERYFPSREKLRQKMLEKCEQDQQLTEKVLTEISEIFIEELLIDQHIRGLIDRHKTAKNIRFTLTRKLFDPLMIEKKLEEYAESLLSWDTYEAHCKKEIEKGISRGKSLSFIRKSLGVKYPLFTKQIESLTREYETSDEINLEHELTKLVEKYPSDSYEARQKIATKLMARGFPYSLIKKHLFP